MTPAPHIRVLLVDSDFIVRCGVAVALQREADIEVIAQASDELRAKELFAAGHEPDVVLLGIHETQWTASESERVALGLTRYSRVLVYGGEEIEDQVFGAVDAGVSGYLCRHARRNAFIDAVRLVAAGRRYFSSNVQEMLNGRNSRKDLSVREVAILRLIAEGLSNKEMASQLNVSPETVKFHVGNVIDKLGARDRTHALVVALRRGLMRLERASTLVV